ncbi:MAG: class I SAM-dependent methyltransferase [Candidatus Erginobacter occultus]|nr:class I SAM-dependent methyltransferase [Candidatus Erginobacter occultus]
MPCPVCRAAETGPFFPDYRVCPECEAVFLLPHLLPDPDEERKRYLLHENDPDNPGYRDFLSRLAGPLLERLAPGMEGLDYGCGPGPALARILEEAGHRVRLYDPFFYPDRSVLDLTYGFITCTETAEHFHDPAGEFTRLDRLLEPGGWLGVMTCFRQPDRDFASWHYRRDPTHVVFYREATFRRLADRFGWQCEFPARDVFLAVKK